ncbi:MAG: hypothetical protein ACYTFT_09585 [Planctomycetota bacterium]|jgi:hypothetical protein
MSITPAGSSPFDGFTPIDCEAADAAAPATEQVQQQAAPAPAAQVAAGEGGRLGALAALQGGPDALARKAVLAFEGSVIMGDAEDKYFAEEAAENLGDAIMMGADAHAAICGAFTEYMQQTGLGIDPDAIEGFAGQLGWQGDPAAALRQALGAFLSAE